MSDKLLFTSEMSCFGMVCFHTIPLSNQTLLVFIWYCELLLFTLLGNEMFAGANAGWIECFRRKVQPFVLVIFRTNYTWLNLANRNLFGVNILDCALAHPCWSGTSYSFIHGVTICCLQGKVYVLEFSKQNSGRLFDSGEGQDIGLPEY